MHLLTSDLLHIVAMANRAGYMAVVSGQAVVIFTPIRDTAPDGSSSSSYRANRVETIAQAWAVIGSREVSVLSPACPSLRTQ